MESKKQWIENHCFTKSKRFNNRVAIESWWKNKGFLKQLEIFKKEKQHWNSITELLYQIYNDTDNKLCEVCGISTKFVNFRQGYKTTCSIQCATQHTKRRQKIKDAQGWKKSQEKTIKKNIELYGVQHRMQDPVFQNSLQRRKMEKYGTLQVNDVKRRQTVKQKYGVEVLFQDQNFQQKIRKIRNEKHGQVKNFKGNTSGAENEINDFLNQYYPFKSNRSVLDGLEIDAYNEDLKMGVEYCGLYWHSEEYKENNYHYNKYNLCKQQNIHLITIFEDEWLERQKQVQQFLRATLGIFETRCFARNLTYKSVEAVDAKRFFNENHIQGFPQHIIYAGGLYDNNHLLGCVSYGRHHRQRDCVVLNRLAFHDSIQIVGGASKLISNSMKNFHIVTTWSDNRWSTGDIYQKCGFVFDGNIRPDYSYVYKQQRLKKQSRQKQKLGISDDVTEHQWHKEKGMFRIYDCGKKRWIKNGRNKNSS